MVQFEVQIKLFCDDGEEDSEQEKRIENIKQSLSDCDVTVLQIIPFNRFKNESSSTNTKKPKEQYNKQLFLQIGFLLEDPAEETAKSAYKSLCARWLEVASQYPANYRPWLVIQSAEFFPNLYESAHKNVPILNFSMGTLFYSSRYYYHATFNNTYGNFYHDLRYLQLFSGNEHIEINYKIIKHLLVFRDDDNIVILLHLTQPPLVFKEVPLINNQVKRFRKANFCDLAVTKVGKTNAITVTFTDNAAAENILARIYNRCGRCPVGYVPLKHSSEVSQGFHKLDMDCFSCLYIIKALLGKNLVLYFQGVENFVKTLKQCHQEDEVILHAAFLELFKLSEQDVPMDYAVKLQSLFNCFKESSPTENENITDLMPNVTSLVRRAVITPTRVLLWPPELVIDNRVLRKYDSACFLRVTFRDDNYQTLSQILDCAPGFYEHTICKPLNNGIRIGPKVFKFLAWSNSQLRSHGVWMYAEDGEGNDVLSIREWMGDFSGISTIPKRMSRMGQCFSHTQDVMEIPLEPEYVETIDDVEGGYDPESKKKYCFSDGIGRISKRFAANVCESLELKYVHTAYQIRYAGYKGMLVLDPVLKDVDISFRKSMLKFECPRSHRLEIVKVSKPCLLYLNRPLINILNQLDVPDRYFLMIQENCLRELIDMLLDGQKAADHLSLHTSISTVDFVELAESGIDLSTEPFFKSLLLAIHCHDISLIKNKARMQIEPNKGRNMFGVLDETGKLDYGQVFVQYTVHQAGQHEPKAVIRTGPVVVTKSPCLSAGDVRKLEAVDIEELHHIRDCIVFPQKGNRPHPSEMGGADLDGDEYSVIWQESLIFPGVNCFPQQFPVPVHPPKYNCGPKLEIEKAVQFFCSYVKNDKVGVIASAHLALSDLKKRGIFDKDCTHIARIFSIAVDFAKNGQAVTVDSDLRPSRYPDFMGNRKKRSYRSTRVLGKLYRNARDCEQVVYHASERKYVQVDPMLEVAGWERYKEEAEMSRNKYEKYLLSLMHTYGICNESEIITGSFSKLHYRHYDRKDQAEIEQLLALCVQHLWQHMSNELFSGIDMEADPEALLKKASAWYMVTYSDENTELISFPWIASHYLAMIKQRRLCSLNLWPCTTNESVMNLETKLSANVDNLKSLDDNLKMLIADRDVEVVETVAKLLISWGQSNKFLKPYRIKRNMTATDLMKHFSLFVEKNRYVLELGAINLLLEYWKFCMSFRFQSKGEAKQEVRSFLTDFFLQVKNLGRHAMYAYHHVALTSDLKILGIGSEMQASENTAELEAMLIPYEVKGSRPLSDVADFLKEWSEVERVELRNDPPEGYWVSARGSVHAVGNLESILQKGSGWLAKSIKWGYMAEDAIVPT